jgi:Holliday junction resolvase RusA-like endonuclease
MSISFFVPGIPAPKGSFRIFRNKRTGAPIVAKDSKKTQTWHDAVIFHAREHMRSRPPVAGPVGVDLLFFFERPKSRKKATYMDVRPDADKLARATLYPMNGIVYEDDARIVHLFVAKKYGSDPGCNIAVWPK